MLERRNAGRSQCSQNVLTMSGGGTTADDPALKGTARLASFSSRIKDALVAGAACLKIMAASPFEV